jgi:hypothetical protein
MKLDGPYLAPPANLMAPVLPPDLENFLPPLGRFSEVSKSLTFSSSVSSIPLDIAYILGTLSLLIFVHSKTSKGFMTSTLIAGFLHSTVLSFLSFNYLSL